MSRHTEGLEKVGNLFRIRETFSITPERVSKISMKESKKVIVEGKDYTVNNSYRFKIWDSDPTEKGFNANGRNYSKIIPMVIKQNPTTLALADHPEDGCESVTKYCGIEKNVRLDDDGWMSFEFIPVGEYGKTICEILDNGGFIEMSSSILGDLDASGYVVPESVQVERLGDWVVNCSCRLLQYSDHIEVHNDDGTRTQLTNNINEKINADEKSTRIEKEGDNRMISDKLVETSMSMNIKSMLKDAENIENLFEKKDALASAHTYANELSDKTLAEEIKSKIDGIDSELKVLSEKGMKADELSESVKTLCEGNDVLEEKIRKLEESKAKVEKQLKIVSTMYENKEYACAESELEKARLLNKKVFSLNVEVKRTKNLLETARKENIELKKKLQKLEAESNCKADANLIAELNEKVQVLTKKNEVLSEKLSETRKSLVESRNRENETQSRFQHARNRMIALRNSRLMENRATVSRSTERASDDDDKMEMMLSH